jgi:hypothetical protein
MKKVNERGSHTTTIEGAKDILKAFKKVGVLVSPGVIEANVRARGKSVKLKKLNNETFEMVVVVNSSKQTFKVYGNNQDEIIKLITGFKSENWNVQAVLDISEGLTLAGHGSAKGVLVEESFHELPDVFRSNVPPEEFSFHAVETP